MAETRPVVYMDNNATTRVAPEVLAAMLPYFSELYGNPSSMHGFGGQVGRLLALAREQVANLIGATSDELIFTSCGTESDSTAILAALQAFPAKRHIVTTRVEHPAVKNLCEHLGQLTGHRHRVTQLPVDREGLLDLEQYEAALSDDTAVVSVMWANNETGVIFPVEKMARIAKNRGILFHTDAVQAAGKIPINLAESAIDFLSLSGHKMHAPKGVGVLYVRKGSPFVPLVVGGHQESGRRGGTENVSSIIGLGRACELAEERMAEENGRIRQLRDKLEDGLLNKIPNSMRNGHRAQRLPNTTSISFAYVEGEAILLHLDLFGICASSGSACTSGSLEPSHVLRAMGVPFTAAHGSVRLSLSVYNTESEVDFVIEKMPGIIAKLRDISPFWQSIPQESEV
ncbi:MAG: cysteine desulfurase NifS [Desulfobulbaceae bacterium]|nr:MAG: cysteine desulfurase NifS [Desulfobulbaceae bacterium]